MRQQIVKGIGGKLWVDFPFVADQVTVTIKRSSGADLAGASVINAEATAEDCTLTILEDLSADIPAEDSKGIPVVMAGEVLPSQGMPVEVRTLEGLNQINTVSWYYQTNVDVDPPEDLAELVIVLRQPMRFKATESATVRSLRAWYSLSAAQCPEIEENFRAVFTATVDETEVYREVIFDVGLRTSDNPATVNDLLNEWPDLRYSETDEWSQEHGFEALRGGWQDVWSRIRATERNPNRIRDNETLKTLIVNRAVRRLAKYGSVPPIWTDDVTGFIDLLDSDFKAEFAQVIAGLQWYDSEDDGVHSGADVVQLDRIRLTR